MGGAAVPAVKGGRRDQGKDGETEQRAGERQIEKGDKGEDAERRQRGNAELRQILAEIGLELLDAIDQCEERGASALAPEMGRPESNHMFVEALAQGHLDGSGGAVRGHGPAIFQHAAQQHHTGGKRKGQDQIGNIGA